MARKEVLVRPGLWGSAELVLTISSLLHWDYDIQVVENQDMHGLPGTIILVGPRHPREAQRWLDMGTVSRLILLIVSKEDPELRESYERVGVSDVVFMSVRNMAAAVEQVAAAVKRGSVAGSLGRGR